MTHAVAVAIALSPFVLYTILGTITRDYRLALAWAISLNFAVGMILGEAVMVRGMVFLVAMALHDFLRKKLWHEGPQGQVECRHEGESKTGGDSRIEPKVAKETSHPHEPKEL